MPCKGRFYCCRPRKLESEELVLGECYSLESAIFSPNAYYLTLANKLEQVGDLLEDVYPLGVFCAHQRLRELHHLPHDSGHVDDDVVLDLLRVALLQRLDGPADPVEIDVRQRRSMLIRNGREAAARTWGRNKEAKLESFWTLPSTAAFSLSLPVFIKFSCIKINRLLPSPSVSAVGMKSRKKGFFI